MNNNNRVQLQCRVKPEIKKQLTILAHQFNTTRGPLIDDLITQLSLLIKYVEFVNAWDIEDLENVDIRQGILTKAKDTLHEINNLY